METRTAPSSRRVRPVNGSQTDQGKEGDPSSRRDSNLLKAIAQNRDQQALTSLFKAYQRSGYNLALTITGNASAADDALQEAFLQIWTSAARFQEPGNARAWIFKIIVRKSLKTLSGRNSWKRTVEWDEKGAESNQRFGPEESLEHKELLAGLSQKLNQLPDVPRHMLALHFLAGLTQREISKELAIPQTTVSDKLRGAIKALQDSLKQAGLAAALPLLNAEDLSETLSLGNDCSPVALNKLLKRITSIDPAWSAPHGLKALALPFVGVAGIGLAVALAGTYPDLFEKGSEKRSESTTPATFPEQGLKSTRVAPPPLRRVPYEKVWTFEEGAPQDLECIQGRWRHAPASKREAARMIAEDFSPDGNGMTALLLRFPDPLPEHYVLTLQAKVATRTPLPSITVVPRWAQGDRVQAMTSWRYSAKRFGYSWTNFKCFGTKEWAAITIGPDLFGIYRLQNKPGPINFILTMHNLEIRRISLSELPLDKMPDYIHRPERFLSQGARPTPYEQGPIPGSEEWLKFSARQKSHYWFRPPTLP